ncbi:MAG: DNA polymerase III subunit alpha [Sediminicola sp.]
MYLNCHSQHSLRYGTIPIKDLVQLGVDNGATAMALTDINTGTAIYEFVRECTAVGIKPLVGMEFRNGNETLYIALAKDVSGFGEMNRYLTGHNLSGRPLPPVAPPFKKVFVIYPMAMAPEQLRDNEFIGIAPADINKLVADKWKSRTERMVVLQPVSFRTKREFNLHRILRAVDGNTLLSKLGPNDHGGPSEHMLPQPQLLDRYRDHPRLIENTQRLIEGCDFRFDFTTPKNKKYYTKDRKGDMALLSSLARHGLIWRYGPNNAQARERMERELKVIDELEFSGYFLITWDIVRYSNSMGFMHIGRGSGANSIVSYCLGITDICPLELDLYFERFLNLNRKRPPDFDIDWSWKERDTILEYIFDRYGRDHVAFCGTNVEFKFRSTVREIGKVFGLPKEELDLLATGAYPESSHSSVSRMVMDYAKMLRGFPNQRSMHSCGILISETPITDYSVLELPPKGFPIVLFDMHVAEDIGFDKFDILSQRGLGHLDECVKLIEGNRGERVQIRDTALSKDNAACNRYLQVGRTIGCFYIESPAMRGLLRRLKCDNYRTLVAASSIIRPGVAQSGMMAEYIFRHNYPDRFEYFHPVFEQQLGETYGIMVYQEDVIKIALGYAGVPATDGDILRRAMSGKGRSLEALQKVKDNFFRCCAEKGHPLALSQEIYRQIESFAGYSFCKAHSASYAVESYQSLYLKVHYPMEFMVAVINNHGGFYRTEVYVHEARMSGAVIHCPCVNKSMGDTTLYGSDVYLGLLLLHGLDGKMAVKIVAERKKNGDYGSLEDFLDRVPIGIETLQLLICIGALRFTGMTKNELLVRARLILVNYRPESREPMLLREPVKEYRLPELPRSRFEDAFDEIELLGFPVSCSPFDLLKTNYRGDVMASQLVAHHKKQVRMLAYLVSRKQVPTKMGDMYFGTWIDVEGAFFDTAHFADCLRKYPFLGGGCYLLLGTVEVDYHFPTITISKMAKMPFVPDPRYAHEPDASYRAHHRLREDVSSTHRAPYPQTKEIALPRERMGGLQKQ